MSIDFRNPLNQGALLARLRAMFTGAAAQAGGAAHAEGAVDGRHADRISLSRDARRIADELRNDRPGADFDADRVAALKQAIESGAFRIDSLRIADKVSLEYGNR